MKANKIRKLDDSNGEIFRSKEIFDCKDPRCAVTEGVVKMDVLIWDNIYKPLLQSEDRVEARDRNQPMVEQCGWKF